MSKPNSVTPNINMVWLISAGLLKYVYYADATYRYHCYAMPGTAIGTAAWMIKRETIADSTLSFAGGCWGFDYAATNISVVGAHSYS